MAGRGFSRVVRADIAATVDHKGRTSMVFWCRAGAKLLFSPQVQAVFLFRVSAALAHTPLRPLAFLLRSLTFVLTGADIHPDAQIGPGFALMHSSGVVIGFGVRIGSDCRATHGVTLGEPGRGMDPSRLRFPTVGDTVTLGAHAVVLGGCTIGDGSIIGANAVVTSDVPADVVAAGNPARVIRELPPWRDDPWRNSALGQPADG